MTTSLHSGGTSRFKNQKNYKSCHRVFSRAWATDSHLGNAGGDGLVDTARHSLSIIQLWNKLVQLDHARLPYIVLSWMSTTNGGWFRRITDLFKTYDLHRYIVNKEVIPLSIAINKITLFENNKWNTSMQLKPKQDYISPGAPATN